MLAVGAIVLHESVYRIAAGPQVAAHSHSYLPLAFALAFVLLAAACLSLGRSLRWALRGDLDEPAHPSIAAVIPLFSATLLAVFGLQEWIESWIAPGHAAGPVHVGQHVGWAGLALAVLLGAIAAGLLRGSHAAIVLLAKRHASLGRLRPTSARGSPHPSPVLRRMDVLAANCAGRAPPLGA
jgi:hypothetical protein